MSACIKQSIINQLRGKERNKDHIVSLMGGSYLGRINRYGVFLSHISVNDDNLVVHYFDFDKNSELTMIANYVYHSGVDSLYDEKLDMYNDALRRSNMEE